MRERKKPRISWVTKTKWILRMEKLKNIIKWIAADGLLHFLLCYATMLALSPIIGWWAILPTAFLAAAKEGFDFFIQKDNNKQQVIHDLICDGAGVVCAYITMLLWLIRIL